MEASQLSILKDVTAFWWVIVLAISGLSVKLGIYIWDRHNTDMKSISDKLNKRSETMKEGFEKINLKISDIERSYTPYAVYEQNRQETRAGQAQIVQELNKVASSLARIEGKLQLTNKD